MTRATATRESGEISGWDGVKYERYFGNPMPFEWMSTEARNVEATNPTDKVLDDLIRISTFVPSAEVKVAFPESWNERTAPTEVDEIFAYKNAIGLRVVSQVSHVYLAALVTMVGRCLVPPVGRLVAMIDVVTETFFEGCPLIRALVQKTGVVPVLVKRHGLRYPHSIDKVSLPSLEFCPTTGYPITYCSRLAYLWLACGKGAEPVERIGGKAVIMPDCIGKESWHRFSSISKLGNVPVALFEPGNSALESFPA